MKADELLQRLTANPFHEEYKGNIYTNWQYPYSTDYC